MAIAKPFYIVLTVCKIDMEALFMTEEDAQSTSNIVWLGHTLC
jgi:hypothetical protein